MGTRGLTSRKIQEMKDPRAGGMTLISTKPEDKVHFWEEVGRLG